MGIFKGKNPKKDEYEQFLEDNPLGTYADFTNEEFSFIGHAETVILESDAWYQAQQDFIAGIRSIDFGQSPNWKAYESLEDWQLAFLMDNYLTIDLEMTAQANNVEDISLDLNEAALNFIARIYLSRALQGDAEDPSVRLEIALSSIEEHEELGTLSTHGSMFRWIE